MLEDPLFAIIAIAVAVVVIILMLGFGSFASAGEFNKRNSNKLMRYRLIAQFIAVILIVGYVWFKKEAG